MIIISLNNLEDIVHAWFRFVLQSFKIVYNHTKAFKTRINRTDRTSLSNQNNKINSAHNQTHLDDVTCTYTTPTHTIAIHRPPTKLVTWPHRWHVSIVGGLPDVRVRSLLEFICGTGCQPANSCADVFVDWLGLRVCGAQMCWLCAC